MSKIGNNPNENIVAANGTFYLCKATVDSPVVIPAGYNAFAIGPITYTGSGSITVGAGSTLVYLGG